MEFGRCLSGHSVHLKLLFNERIAAFIFLNIEAFIAPVVIPLSGLLLIQIQKKREEELLMHSY
jgi:hypothetical protein